MMSYLVSEPVVMASVSTQNTGRRAMMAGSHRRVCLEVIHYKHRLISLLPLEREISHEGLLGLLLFIL